MCIRDRVKAFQSGASFALDYTITSTEAEPPALYALLDKFGGTTGSLKMCIRDRHSFLLLQKPATRRASGTGRGHGSF